VSEAPAWIDKRALLLTHQESLAQFGGAVGLRDEGLLDSALARPINKYTSDGCNDLAVLAAAYGFELVRNRPFVDGNKRVAFLAVGVFLAINGQRLTANPIDAMGAVMSLSDESNEEERFSEWVRRNLCKDPARQISILTRHLADLSKIPGVSMETST
jgi:death-on-curing protein